MIVAIHQPNFIPWIGFFNKLANSDIFVLFDDVQFPTGRSFGNRVLIKSYSGPLWLTVPVRNRGEMLLFNEVQIENISRWKEKMVKTLLINYGKAKYFKEIFQPLRDIISTEYSSIVDINFSLIKFITQYLKIDTKIIFSSDLKLLKELNGEEKIIRILKTLNSSVYLSGEGSGTKRYINEDHFDQEKIKIVYQHFKHPEYPQLYGEFVQKLSVIDLLFNCGPESKKIIISGNG